MAKKDEKKLKVFKVTQHELENTLQEIFARGGTIWFQENFVGKPPLEYDHVFYVDFPQEEDK